PLDGAVALLRRLDDEVGRLGGAAPHVDGDRDLGLDGRDGGGRDHDPVVRQLQLEAGDDLDAAPVEAELLGDRGGDPLYLGLDGQVLGDAAEGELAVDRPAVRL